jgi:hypothetical protein
MEKSERRKLVRFAVKDIAFAVLKTDTDEELGQIINISPGGLAFQYFVGNRSIQKSDVLDMLLPDNGFHIDNIKFKTVADFEMSNELPFSSIRKRQQSVCFSSLSVEQKADIEKFIRNHTHILKD